MILNERCGMMTELNINSFLEDITSKLPNLSIKRNEPLKHYTYTETGGPADLYISPSLFDEVELILSKARTHQIPVTYLGNGSNIIIRDGGIRGIVLSLLNLTDIYHENQLVHAMSGAAIIDVSQYAHKQSLSGLEFACGIPGSVGGAIYMNAGAYGGEVKDCLKYIIAATNAGEILTIDAADLQLDYRKSIIQKNNYVVLKAVFELSPGEQSTIKLMMEDLTERRSSKQPLEYPSCGSVFQRPPGHFAGKLIQESGLQGYRIGGVEVSKKHAGFMVNVDHGTASDYEALIKHVQQTVKEKFDIELNCEVRIIGEHK